MADVETCVKTLKQVEVERMNKFNILLFQDCKEGMLRTWRKICDRIIPGSAKSDNSDTESVMSTS